MKKYLKPLELGVVEFGEDYPSKLYSCLSKYYNIEDSSIRLFSIYRIFFTRG